MNKSIPLTVSPQTPITVYAWDSLEYLALKPILLQRFFLADGQNEYKPTQGWGTGFIGGHYSTGIQSNEHGQVFLYVNRSAVLTATGNNTVFSISIDKNGNDVTYNLTSAEASITPYTVFSDDIVGAVRVTINPDANTGQPQKSTNPPKVNHDVYSIDEDTGDIKLLAPTKGTSSITIPNTEPFSQLINASIYYEKSIYQLQGESYVAINNLTLNGFGSAGGYFSLTGNSSNLYPEGTSTLIFKDGYSENEATIEFTNTQIGQVTISIKSHTYRICEFRDIQTDFANFRNCLCLGV